MHSSGTEAQVHGNEQTTATSSSDQVDGGLQTTATFPVFIAEDLVTLQERDLVIGRCMELLMSGITLTNTSWRKESHTVQALRKHWPKLFDQWVVALSHIESQIWKYISYFCINHEGRCIENVPQSHSTTRVPKMLLARYEQ